MGYDSAQNSGETVAGCIQNLKPWPKGVSGNPGGRPKTDFAKEIARAVFENNAEGIYRAMVQALKKGDARLFKVLAERAYGKVSQNLESENSCSPVLLIGDLPVPKEFRESGSDTGGQLPAPKPHEPGRGSR